ncbi:hypothetical protein ZYGR_0AK01550 [Zygosaccharomyces rouxii]|uniref:Uncharacterized protein n=1 Tax=Zygosaccharomyces rouxii TaxID=4956 RepID=A0A1Q3ADS6_ZYGRO|nr:hypothetical protein ZYGR_0AK01550 [Zygosaccharomyces rouxii]
MSLLQDYESSSEDESTVNELPRPVYVRPCKRHHRVEKPDVTKQAPKHHPSTKLSKPSKPLVYERVASKQERSPRNPVSRPNSHAAQEQLFEYGEPVNGYKFLTTPDNIRLLQAHQLANVPGQEPSYLQNYWNLVDRTLLPVDPGNQINRDNVHSFYQKSCDLLKQDMKKIIKGERIRWHPDRMHLPEATQIFQIINDLWESLQEA